jgi:tellurite resistance protein TerC
MPSMHSLWLWGGFSLIVLVMLALDLGVFHRRAHAVGHREALTWSAVWIALALTFNAAVYFWLGPQKGLEFLTGYLIEKALSVDNIFIFVVLFSFFAVPREHQHRVLYWGVIGALLMRGLMIGLGAVLIARFHWILYVFGGILIITGIKMLVQRTSEPHPERNPVYRAIARMVPSTPEYHGQKFFTRINGRTLATPLFLVLMAVEATDLVFAVDSIPAIFAVTTDPFIVYSSNVFAILGLRSLYFVLAGIIEKFRFLKVGLALVLCFVGAKMLAAGFYKVPIVASLLVIVAILAGSIVASLIIPKKREGSEEKQQAA